MPNSRRLSDEQLRDVDFREHQASRLFDQTDDEGFAKCAIECSLIFADHARSLPADQESRIEALFWDSAREFSNSLLPISTGYRILAMRGNEDSAKLDQLRSALIRFMGRSTQRNALVLKIMRAIKKVVAVLGCSHRVFAPGDDVEMVDVDCRKESSSFYMPRVHNLTELMARYAIYLGQEMGKIETILEKIQRIEERLGQIAMEEDDDDEDGSSEDEDDLEKEEDEDEEIESDGEVDEEVEVAADGEEHDSDGASEESDTYDADNENENDDEEEEEQEEEDVDMGGTTGAITQLPVRGRPAQADCDADVY